MNTPATRVRREDIYAAAARLFREKGYAATSMRELAAEVGLEASSLYSHITSKAELLDHLCFSTADRFLAGMASIQATDLSPVDKIRHLIGLHVRIALEDPTSQTVFSDEWKHLPADRLQQFLGLRRRYETQFQAVIEEGQQAGQIGELPADLIWMTLLSGLRWIHTGRKLPASDQAAGLADALSRLFIEGILPRVPRRRPNAG